MTIVRLKYMSGRTTEQEPGRNSVVEGGILYLSPGGFNYLQCRLYEDTSGSVPEELVDTAVKELGVTDAEMQRRTGRGFNIVIDYDMDYHV